MAHHVSATAKITCRVCKEKLLKKNYKAHLQLKHPEQDPSDLSPHLQMRITSFCQSQSQPAASTSQQSRKRPHDESDVSEVPVLEVPVRTEQPSTQGSQSAQAAAETRTSRAAASIPHTQSKVPRTEPQQIATLVTLPSTSSHAQSVEEKVDLILKKVEVIGQDVKTLTQKGSSQSSHEQQSRPRPTAEGQSMTPVTTSTRVNPTLPEDKVDKARSLKDLEEVGFGVHRKTEKTNSEDDEDQSTETVIVYCKVCVESEKLSKAVVGDIGVFLYDTSVGVEFAEGEVMSSKFRNTKKNIKRHLQRDVHVNNLKSQEEKQQKDAAYAAKNIVVGMAIGRTCYYLYSKGRPFADFESLLFLQELNGINIGNINHGQDFARNFLPHVAEVVSKRINQFISSPLQQTGHRPPLNVSADKATYKHRTRQFVSAVTVVPGSDNLIQYIFLGSPVVKAHDGISVAKNWKEAMDARLVTADQIAGGSVDGQYFHLRVSSHLEELYGMEEGSLQFFWDPMHKSGLVDTHLMKEDKFKWVLSDIEVCMEVYRMFNWGQNYERLLEACEEMKTTLAALTRTSDTRFANSKRYIFINFLKDLEAVVACLEEACAAAEREGATSRDKKRAEDASTLKGKLHNQRFLLRVAGEADLYNCYGTIINVLQSVDMLPFERMEKFRASVQRMMEMARTVIYDECQPCQAQPQLPQLQAQAEGSEGSTSVKCQWPEFHAAIRSLTNKGEIKGVVVVDQEEVHVGRVTRGAAAGQIPEGESSEDTVQLQVSRQLKNLATKLSSGLETDVYKEEDQQRVGNTKTICDMHTLHQLVKKDGPTKVEATHTQAYIQAIRNLDVKSLNEVPDKILTDQFSKLLLKLSTLPPSSSNDSKEIIKSLFLFESGHYKGIEMILHGIAVAAVSFSVESVLESVVSRYEAHFDMTRTLQEERSLSEMEVAMNGPGINNCDDVVKSAMNLYWRQRKYATWHFIKRGVHEHLKYGDKSKVMVRLANKKSKLPFVDGSRGL